MRHIIEDDSVQFGFTDKDKLGVRHQGGFVRVTSKALLDFARYYKVPKRYATLLHKENIDLLILILNFNVKNYAKRANPRMIVIKRNCVTDFLSARNHNLK